MKRKLALYIPIALYFLSLCLPAIVYDRGVDFGYTILLNGWLGFFVSMYAWYANPIGIFSFGCMRHGKYKTGAVSAIVAMVIGLRALTFKQKLLDEGGLNVWHVQYLAVGYYVWEGSFIFTLFYCLYRIWKPHGIAMPSNQPFGKTTP
jgi:hypothetical protein